MAPHDHAQNFSLYAANGARKYLNQPERQRVLARMATLPPDRALFALTLAWTGGRVSEVLALSTTAIYADVAGPEELEIAARFWRSGRVQSTA